MPNSRFLIPLLVVVWCLEVLAWETQMNQREAYHVPSSLDCLRSGINVIENLPKALRRGKECDRDASSTGSMLPQALINKVDKEGEDAGGKGDGDYLDPNLWEVLDNRQNKYLLQDEPEGSAEPQAFMSMATQSEEEVDDGRSDMATQNDREVVLHDDVSDIATQGDGEVVLNNDASDTTTQNDKQTVLNDDRSNRATKNDDQMVLNDRRSNTATQSEEQGLLDDARRNKNYLMEELQGPPTDVRSTSAINVTKTSTRIKGADYFMNRTSIGSVRLSAGVTELRSIGQTSMEGVEIQNTYASKSKDQGFMLNKTKAEGVKLSVIKGSTEGITRHKADQERDVVASELGDEGGPLSI